MVLLIRAYNYKLPYKNIHECVGDILSYVGLTINDQYEFKTKFLFLDLKQSFYSNDNTARITVIK